MNRELAILLVLLLLTGSGTAWIVFNHDNNRDPDPFARVQSEVCGKLRKNAIYLFRQKDHYEAERQLRRLLKINPEDREMRLLYGRILFETQRIFEAEKLFRKMISVNLLDSGARNNLGVILLLQGKYEEAYKELSAASRLDSGSEFAPHNLEVAGNALELEKSTAAFDIVVNVNRIFMRNIGTLSVELVMKKPVPEKKSL